MSLRLVIPVAVALLTTRAAVAESPAERPLTDRQKVAHVLNRLGYGARPGDVERIERMGLDAWIDLQLHPERIDDSAVDGKLKSLFPNLSLPTRKLLKPWYEEIRGFLYAEMQKGDAEDFKRRTGIDLTKQKGAAGGDKNYKAPKNELAAAAKMFGDNVTLVALAELQTAKIIRAAESERQLNEVLADFWFNHFNVDAKKDACRIYVIVDDRDVIRPHVFDKFRRLLGLVAASPGMLTYLDNWQNSSPHTVGVLEQRIRSFGVENLIGIEIAELKPTNAPKTEGGRNENYARELLELHTLGVDGGYTQKDVEEVARCFTGWSVNPFLGVLSFEGRKHDGGEKTVLGHTIPAGGGVQDGMAVLDILAKHPSTARFISTKLCRRFVSDDPPAALVDRAARVFTETDGDLRAVVRAIVTSPEFFSTAAYRAKIKSPFEYAVSAVRAAGGRVEPRDFGVATRQVRFFLEGAGTSGYGAERLSATKPKTVNWHIYDMGQPLYACQPPTGYPEDSRKWVSSGALISRLNFATALTSTNGTIDAMLPADLSAAAASSGSMNPVLDGFVERVLNGEVSAQTKAALTSAAAKQKDATPGQLLSLVLGTPEFQRR
jgi:uncharacterized protein (DUF1800 family)